MNPNDQLKNEETAMIPKQTTDAAETEDQPVTNEQNAMDAAFEAATESRYISFKDRPIQLVTFVNPGFKTTVGQNGEPQFEFDVLDVTNAPKILSTQSARLMNALKKIYNVEHSLMGIRAKIMRTGDGYQTQYTAEAIK